MHFGFSYMGFLFLLLLIVPNLLWTKYKPKDYEKYVSSENRVLRLLERIGEAAVSCLALVFSDHDPHGVSAWEIWLLIACVCMVLYEIFWIRYFRSPKTMADFYRSLLGVPVAGATLPVAAFFFLGIYGKDPFLLLAVIVLGIGHIGIHLGHQKASA